MADSSVPLWFSALTFFIGTASSQLTELFRSRRERSAHRDERRATNLDRRLQFQHENLMLIQDNATASLKRYLFLHNSRGVIGYDKMMEEKISQESEAHRENVWRLGVLASRVSDSDVRKKCYALHTILDGTQAFISGSDREEEVEAMFDRFNELNKSIAIYLRTLDELEDSNDR